ncbi:hypothetical protein LZ32DRAFT_123816 [Colletotrichum eremochloae]|nr:hypothetical protein LZ32DRAFT_123816 [Colletotrichum eremochloae]
MPWNAMRCREMPTSWASWASWVSSTSCRPHCRVVEQTIRALDCRTHTNAQGYAEVVAKNFVHQCRSSHLNWAVSMVPSQNVARSGPG